MNGEPMDKNVEITSASSNSELGLGHDPICVPEELALSDIEVMIELVTGVLLKTWNRETGAVVPIPT